MKTLEYYFAKKEVLEHVIFNKYTIDENGIIRMEKTEALKYSKNGKYNRCSVVDNKGKRRQISVCRAIASTFIGPPPTLKHTADHKDQDTTNNTIGNIRWLCKSGQRKNQTRPTSFKSALVVVKDGVDKTVKEWVEYLKGEKNSFGRDYTKGVIESYAKRKQYGYSYKEYPDIPGEVWKDVKDSKNSQGRWEISNMNRVKYITKYAENVLSGDRLGLLMGYPIIYINGVQWLCHILSFMTFFPDLYAAKKTDEMVLHENDDKLDFRPHKLSLGTQSKNMTDAYDNGKRDGAKFARVRCASYIDDVFEKEHESLEATVKHLKKLGYDRAGANNIGKALTAYQDGEIKIRYDRTWKRI